MSTVNYWSGQRVAYNGAYLCWPDGFAQMIQTPVLLGPAIRSGLIRLPGLHKYGCWPFVPGINCKL
jgi:hypothetical protein